MPARLRRAQQMPVFAEPSVSPQFDIVDERERRVNILARSDRLLQTEPAKLAAARHLSKDAFVTK
ncbi:hypothetical protein [Paraburkholderia guartelaensis]|uniref:hypothetical protein n=1 Tax=Paraburkholderia guartelaensis TaxID=2546446 RepID=UPI001408A313|nr:hypothetical protein [Paraburkholderia guartelaensis]